MSRIAGCCFGSLILAVALLPAGAADDDKDWKQLFNGKDLTGWKTHPDDKSKWEVVDGAIVGSGPPGHLFSEKGDYENFHYKIEAKINNKGNSGQYFRTQYGKAFPKGYEAQINTTHGDPIKTGSLYMPGVKEVLVKEAPHKPDEWFTQEVIANGNHIIIKVNDKETVNYKDPKNTYTKGHFAIQAHDPGSVVHVKKVLVKELPPTKSEK